MKYKFTGKERDNESSWYDYFGARFYSSKIGRWGQIEPLYNLYYPYSPYTYSINNTINSYDLNGKVVILSQEDQIYLADLLGIVKNEINKDYTSLIDLAIDKNNTDITISYLWDPNKKAEYEQYWGMTGEFSLDKHNIYDAIGISIFPEVFKSKSKNIYIDALLLEHELFHLDYFINIQGFKKGHEVTKWLNKIRNYHSHEILAYKHSIQKLKELYKNKKISKEEYRETKNYLKEQKEYHEEQLHNLTF